MVHVYLFQLFSVKPNEGLLNLDVCGLRKIQRAAEFITSQFIFLIVNTKNCDFNSF